MSIKKALRGLGYTLLGVFGFLVLYLLSAFGLSRIGTNAEGDTKDQVSIYIKTNGVHTDIVVPVRNGERDWSNEVLFINVPSKDTTYSWLGMGWGDKGFYLETPTWAELKASVAFKAATGLGSTAIHCTFYHSITEDSSCVKIGISKKQYRQLIDYIDGSFKKNEQGHLQFIQTNANYSKDDAFYDANGSYSMFHTCNTWANNALKACGQKAALWTVFDTGIFIHYE